MSGRSARPPRTATIVFDTEMGWGSIENERIGPREREGVFDRARGLLPRVLSALAEREVPSTWAVVGALLDPRAADRLDHLPPDRADQIRTALETHETKTLHLPRLGELLASSAGVEVGCHSWSHTRFDFPGLDAAAVSADLALWRESVTGLVPEGAGASMVCPRDTIGFVDELAGAGIDALRVPPGHEGPPPAWARRLRWPRPARRGGFDTPHGRIETLEGTIFLRPGGMKLAYSALRARAAIASHPVTLVWLHPFNFGEDGGLFGSFVQLLDDLVRRREEGELEVHSLSGALGVNRD